MRNLAKFVRGSSRLQATAAKLLLQKKHMTFKEYETIEAMDQLATTEPELCTVWVHLRSLGHDEGATPRTLFTSMCPRPPTAEAPTSLGPSNRRKNSDPQPHSSSPRVTTDAKLNMCLMLILDGHNTDIKTKAGRSHQPEGVRLQLLVLIHSGNYSRHSAQRREGAWKSLHPPGHRPVKELQ